MLSKLGLWACFLVSAAPVGRQRGHLPVVRDKVLPLLRGRKLGKHAACRALTLLSLAALCRYQVRLQVSWESQGWHGSQGPSERRFRGSRGVLKSALQKNVRLGRTDASVR